MLQPAAFSSEELDRVYSVGPASVSAQFVTQSAVVPEIARSQPADPPSAPPPGPAPPSAAAAGAAPPPALLAPPGVDPQGPGSPSHFLSGNIRVSSVGPAPPAADEPIYENVDFIQRGRAYTGPSSTGGGGAAEAVRPADTAALPTSGSVGSGGGVGGGGGGVETSRWARGVAPPQDIPIPAAAMQEIGVNTPTHVPAGSNSSTLEKRRRKRWGGGESTPPDQSKSNTLRKIKETFIRSRDPQRIRTSGGSGSGSGSGLSLSQCTPDVVVKRESTAIPREQRVSEMQ